MNRRKFLVAAAPALATLAAGCSPLAALNAVVPSSTYAATTDIAYGHHPRHVLDVYVPAPAVTRAPVVMFFYGGNWRSGERADFRFVGEALASRGFVTVIPDFRLHPEVRFPAFLEDSADAVQWASAHIGRMGGDPDRIFLMGHSSGAYTAAMLAFDDTYLAARGVEARRVRGWIGIAGPYDFLPLTGAVAKAVFGFPGTSEKTQPIHFVTGEAPPTLLLTPERDATVDPGNSARLARALRAAGVPVRQIAYPEVGHRTILGAVAAPLRYLAPVLEDIARYVDTVASPSV